MKILASDQANGIHEPLELNAVKLSERPYAGTEIDAERTDPLNGLGNVVRPQTTGQEDGFFFRLPDEFGADFPVVRSSGAAQLNLRRGRSPAVKEKSMRIRVVPFEQVQGGFVLHMNHLGIVTLSAV